MPPRIFYDIIVNFVLYSFQIKRKIATLLLCCDQVANDNFQPLLSAAYQNASLLIE